jgi:hypothetical protein
MYDTRLRGGMVGACRFADGDLGTQQGMVQFSFSPLGRIEVEDVQTGVPFSVQLFGMRALGPSAKVGLLAEIAIDSLGTTEQRRIDFTLDPAELELPGGVRGQVLDEQGRPVLGAGISTCIACDMRIATSDLDGVFLINTARRSTIDVEVYKRGFVPFRVRDWDVRSGRALEARLARGRDLRLVAVDAQDRPIDGVVLRAEIDGFGLVAQIESGPIGVFTLRDLPEGIVQLAWNVGGVRYLQTQRSDAGLARIVLPEHGRLDATWQWRAALDNKLEYRLLLRPLDAALPVLIGWTPSPERVESCVFPSVLPGEYELGFEVRRPSEAAQEAAYAPLHAPTQLRVSGGTTTQVKLMP